MDGKCAHTPHTHHTHTPHTHTHTHHTHTLTYTTCTSHTHTHTHTLSLFAIGQFQHNSKYYMFQSVHNSEHDGTIRIFVHLSECNLTEQFYPNNMSSHMEHKSMVT